MGERPIRKNNKPRWKIKIKELKKDIEIFQSELEDLLRNVPASTNQDNICVFCDKNIATYKLPCQHDICTPCQQNHRKNKAITICPVCRQTHHHRVYSSDSFSSDEMV